MAGDRSGTIRKDVICNDVGAHVLPAFILLEKKKTLCAGLRCAAGGGTSGRGIAGQKLDVNTKIVQRL